LAVQMSGLGFSLGRSVAFDGHDQFLDVTERLSGVGSVMLAELPYLKFTALVGGRYPDVRPVWSPPQLLQRGGRSALSQAAGADSLE